MALEISSVDVSAPGLADRFLSRGLIVSDAILGGRRQICDYPT